MNLILLIWLKYFLRWSHILLGTGSVLWPWLYVLHQGRYLVGSTLLQQAWHQVGTWHPPGHRKKRADQHWRPHGTAVLRVTTPVRCSAFPLAYGASVPACSTLHISMSRPESCLDQWRAHESHFMCWIKQNQKRAIKSKSCMVDIPLGGTCRSCFSHYVIFLL